MRWSEKVWEEIHPIYDKILEHPFIEELIDGTLSHEKFSYYIRQDAIYLAEYGKILAGVASKMCRPEFMEAFLFFAADTMTVEKTLHESFLNGMEKANVCDASPSCMLYTSYLHKHLANSSPEVTTAAVLPCFWIYMKVGDYILKYQTKRENPYQNWINTYAGKEYSKAVDIAITICDNLAEKATEKQQELMTDAFVTGSKLEWMFWDSAWKLERWNI